MDDAQSPHGQGKHGSMEPGTMMAQSPAHRPWVYPAMMLLGAWLATSPTVLAYGRPALVWSDVLSGVAAIAIALVAAALPRRWAWIAFGNAFVGLWVIFAPLVFWAPSPAVFLNGTLVGAMLIAFSVIEPMGMPMDGPELPPGWTYNPSSWAQRTPIILLGLVGLFLSRIMAGFQLGYIDSIWEPFFGAGTRSVLESEVSRSFPISDAGLGMITWHAFWFGGTPAGTHDAPPPDRQPSWSPGAMLWRFTPTGGLLVASGPGAWMMFAPAVFGSSGVMRDSSFVVGALVIVVSVIAMADLARVARYFNLALGAWLVVAPWVLSDVEAGARWNAVLVGLLVSVASLPLGAGATGTGARRGRRSGSRATRRGSVAGDLLSPVTRPLTEAGRWRGTVAGREGSWTVYAAPAICPCVTMR